MPLKLRVVDRVTSGLGGGHLKYYMLAALMLVSQFCWECDLLLYKEKKKCFEKIHVSCQMTSVGLWSCGEYNM
jgi:hypothetical protein